MKNNKRLQMTAVVLAGILTVSSLCGFDNPVFSSDDAGESVVFDDTVETEVFQTKGFELSDFDYSSYYDADSGQVFTELQMYRGTSLEDGELADLVIPATVTVPDPQAVSGETGEGVNTVTSRVVIHTGPQNYQNFDVKGKQVRSIRLEKGVMLIGSELGFFDGLTKLETVDLSGADLTGIFTNQNYQDTPDLLRDMFSGCSSLTSFQLPQELPAKNLWNVSGMFYGCSSLKEVDLSTLDLSQTYSTGDMFNGCSSLKTIYTDSGHDNLGTDIRYTNPTYNGSPVDDTDMFAGCNLLRGGMGTSFSSNSSGKTYARIDRGVQTPGWQP